MKIVLSESKLIQAITNHDPAAATALYDQYAPTLYKVICCSARSCEHAEEVLAKTFATVWNNFDDFHRQEKSLLLWMVGIARRYARQIG